MINERYTCNRTGISIVFWIIREREISNKYIIDVFYLFSIYDLNVFNNCLDYFEIILKM